MVDGSSAGFHLCGFGGMVLRGVSAIPLPFVAERDQSHSVKKEILQ
jgi:hypothetical protein